MQKQLTFGSETISYTLRRSSRARRMRLTVHRDGSVVLTMPARAMGDMAVEAGEKFVQRSRRWLMEKLAAMRRLPPLPPVNPVARYGRREYLRYREQARELALAKIHEFHSRLGDVPHGRVSIRNQKTCWGSCSRKGNLNFNYKLLFLPARLQDYVIVHELAHLTELNHSPRFWAFVGSVLPDHRALRRELRAMRML